MIHIDSFPYVSVLRGLLPKLTYSFHVRRIFEIYYLPENRFLNWAFSFILHEDLSVFVKKCGTRPWKIGITYIWYCWLADNLEKN